MPDFTQRVDLWKFHLSAKIPKSISYEELAEMSDTLAGGDIKNITLKLCIKLSANKLTSLDKKMVEAEIEKYVQALAASQGGKLIKKLPDEQ
jgi:ATP-dependent 26S proteasome regulatory subunit